MIEDKNLTQYSSQEKKYVSRLQMQKELLNVLKIDDKSLGREIANEKEDSDIHIQLLKSVNKSSELNHRQKRALKPKFFWIVMIMYMVVILGSVATMIIIPLFCKEWYAILPSVVASIASIITALIKIPSIIAEYLFPKEEDDILIRLSSNVFRHDERIKNIDKQDK